MHASVIRVRIYGKIKSERHSDTKTKVIITKINADFDVLDFINLSEWFRKDMSRGSIIKTRIKSIVITFITLLAEICQAILSLLLQ